MSGNTEPYIILIADTGNRYKGPLLDILETHLDKRWRVESVDLSRHDAEVRAQALREAADEAERHANEGCPSCSNNPVSACSGANNLTAAWLRSRAEQTKEDR